jgi:hypothetical protein
LFLQAHDQCTSQGKNKFVNCNSGSFKTSQVQLSGDKFQNNGFNPISVCNQGEGIYTSVKTGLSVNFEGKNSFENNIISCDD